MIVLIQMDVPLICPANKNSVCTHCKSNTCEHFNLLIHKVFGKVKKVIHPNQELFSHYKQFTVKRHQCVEL